MDIRLFDNYEEDGQMSLFGAEEQEFGTVERERTAENVESDRPTDIRIRNCSSCGKLLFVREEETAFLSECNNCGIRYRQKR